MKTSASSVYGNKSAKGKTSRPTSQLHHRSAQRLSKPMIHPRDKRQSMITDPTSNHNFRPKENKFGPIGRLVPEIDAG